MLENIIRTWFIQRKINMSELKEDELSGYYEEETYTKGLDRESTIEKQVQTAIFFYSRAMWAEFEYSVRALAVLLPKDVRDVFILPPIDVTDKGIQEYFKLFTLIQEKLELDTNLIFKKRFIKTYEQFLLIKNYMSKIVNNYENRAIIYKIDTV